MLLQKTQHQFIEKLEISKPIDSTKLKYLKLTDFDKDGYEVSNPIEKEFYETNSIWIYENIQNHIAPVRTWYNDIEESEKECILDHSMLLMRYAYVGEARDQLEKCLSKRPILNKLLKIKPKWGIDFSLDWVDIVDCFEIIHIEQDFFSYEEAIFHKEKIEELIESTDWVDAAKSLMKKKDEWIYLSSDDHSDYKAKFFGLSRAFNNKKVHS